MRYAPAFHGQMRTPDSSSGRFDWDEFKRMLNGVTLTLEIFWPGERDILLFSIAGGEFDGGLLMAGHHGTIFSIASVMTDIKIREATSDEQLQLAPYINPAIRNAFLGTYIQPAIRNVFDEGEEKADNYWVIIDCREGTYYFWAYIAVMIETKEAVIRDSTDDFWRERISRRPLWDGGPSVAQL